MYPPTPTLTHRHSLAMGVASVCVAAASLYAWAASRRDNVAALTHRLQRMVAGSTTPVAAQAATCPICMCEYTSDNYRCVPVGAAAPSQPSAAATPAGPGAAASTSGSASGSTSGTCGHQFCRLCLLQVLTTSCMCPLCRREYVEVCRADAAP